MTNYSAPMLMSAVSTTYKTAAFLWAQGTVAAGSLRRLQVYELEFGQTGGLSSSDCQVQWDVSRFTATTTAAGTFVVPSALDTGDLVSPWAQYLNVLSAEPANYSVAGSGLSIKNWGINQRGSYRWRALDDGDNIIVPATTLSGVGVRCLSTSFSSTATGTISFIER